jgi:hypothetical protein
MLKGILDVRPSTLIREVVQRHNQPAVLTKLIVSEESLQTLIDKPESVIGFDVSPVEMIWILNQASTDL